MKKIFGVLLFFASLGLWAQISNPSIVVVPSAPSGSCSVNLPNQQVASTGALYSCQSGTWGLVGGGAPTNCTAGTYACLGLANIFTATQTINADDAGLVLNSPTLKATEIIYEQGGTPVLTSGMGGSDYDPGYYYVYAPRASRDLIGIGNLQPGNTNFRLSYLMSLAWGLSAASNGGVDAGLSRIGPGIVAAGNGNPGDTSGWFQSAAIGNGVSGNTDLRGHVTLVSGSGTYTFAKVYTVAPTCVAVDTTTAAAVKVSATTTVLTLTGTGTDTLNYICAD